MKEISFILYIFLSPLSDIQDIWIVIIRNVSLSIHTVIQVKTVGWLVGLYYHNKLSNDFTSDLITLQHKMPFIDNQDGYYVAWQCDPTLSI